MAFYYTYQSVPQSSSDKFLLAVDGNNYKDPQLDNGQRIRDLGTISCKWAVSIKSLSSKLRELCRREGRDEVECPSVCYEYILLPLVNKETALVYGRVEYR